MASAFQPNAFQGNAFQSNLTAGADLGVSYRIKAHVDADLTVDWRIGTNPVGVELPLLWNQTFQPHGDLVVDYWIHVGDPVGQSQSFDYLTYAHVGTNLDFDYKVTGSAGISLIVDYFLNPFAWIALDVDYKVTNVGPSVDLGFDYRIMDAASADLTVDYGMYGSFIASTWLPINYAIDTLRDVVIRYDDIDITEHLIYRECEFTSQTNGSVGTATVLLRDSPFSASFTTGKSLELFIGGELKWAGFVTNVGREYPFSYEDLQGNIERLPRYYRLQGSDINILFERRFTVHESTPTLLEGPTFKADNTPDVTAIRALCDTWLDLRGDGIDTVSMVEHVGNINVDQPANPFQAGQSWKSAMYSIASLPAAVFYITPDKKLVYTDVDTVTNPLVLTDQPDDPELAGLGIGYRNMRWEALGEKMTNDYLAWGVRQAPVVFKRLEDDPSIALHGRWQDADTNPSVYKQATINKIADRQVYGSPGSRRGHKDNRDSVSCTTFVPGFNVAQKVRVISNTFDYDDVLPIRRMRITFPGPAAPQYDLVLSHEIDTFGFFDVVRIGGGKKPPVPVVEPPPPPPPPPPLPMCVALDTFSNRTTNYTYHRDLQNSASTGGWGTGELLTWQANGVQMFVGGGAGVLHAREPMWPSPYSFGGGEVGAQAMIPAGISANNVVIKFAIGRLERILPGGGISTSIEVDLTGFGPDQWFDIPYGHDYDQHAVDGYGVQAHWGTRAYIPAMVRGSAVEASYAMSSLYGPITRTLFRGSTPNYGFQADGHGGSWHPNGAGFYPGVSLWGNSGGETDGRKDLAWSVPDGGGWGQYWGGLDLYDYQYAGPDSTFFIFNQAVSVRFTIGGQTVTIGKGHGVFGTTGDGISGSMYGVHSGPPGGAFSNPSANYIEPGFTHFLRWWRPNNGNSYTKVWQSWAQEPDEWQSHGGSHPPIAYDTDGNPIEWPNGHPTDENLGSQLFEIAAQIFTMDQYSVIIDGIWACTDVVDTEYIPIQKPVLPHGSTYTEHFASVVAEAGVHTIVPYIPGSLTLSINGTMQRRGIDFVEADPSKGTFTLMFEPDVGDKVTVRYLVA